MAVKTKTAVVSKKVSDTQLLNSQRWEAFVINCQIPWDDLSEPWKDFYETMAPNGASSEDIVKAIDAAIESDKIKEISNG